MTAFLAPLLGWLFGKSVIAKIALFVVAAVTLGIAFFGLKFLYDRQKRREGAAKVVDELKDQSRAREERMKRAPKPDDDDEVTRMLEQGRG